MPTDEILREIALKRCGIQEEFAKAWLAAVVPDGNLTAEWLIRNVEMCEVWSEDRLKVTWFFRLKPDSAIREG